MVALGSLIAGVIVNLEKYKEYSLEIKSLHAKYEKLNKEKEVPIPAKEYDDINDKLLYRQREILKFIADHQSSSFSYINLREYIVKRKYIERDLNEDIKKLLYELLDIRNMSFHNPQSMLVAAQESAKKRAKIFEDMLSVEPQLNPIIIDHKTHYDFLMLITLVLHSQERIANFELILDNMKSDYSDMYEKIPNKKFHFVNGKLSNEVFYHKLPRISRFVSVANDMPSIAIAIQKSKYDGTDETFEN